MPKDEACDDVTARTIFAKRREQFEVPSYFNRELFYCTAELGNCEGNEEMRSVSAAVNLPGHSLRNIPGT